MPRIRRALALAALVLLAACGQAARAGDGCADSVGRGSLGVVTLNLLFYEVRHRDERVAVVADGLAAAADAGSPVDVVLLQEVVGGRLSGTDNAAIDLQRAARARGVDYDLRYATYFAVGDPPLLAVSNAILSRCRIVDSVDIPLPVAVEDILPQVSLPIRRVVSLAVLDLAGRGRLSVYNTHLCAYCDPADRLAQAQTMMDAIEFVQARVPGAGVVLGGDMNTRVDVPAQRPLYDLITDGHGFRDAYAEFNACTDCCSAADGYAGCSFAVPGNPFAVDLVTREPEAPQRLDYVFVRPGGLGIEQALVTPTSAPWVSDHSAVLVRLALPR